MNPPGQSDKSGCSEVFLDLGTDQEVAYFGRRLALLVAHAHLQDHEGHPQLVAVIQDREEQLEMTEHHSRHVRCYVRDRVALMEYQ